MTNRKKKLNPIDELVQKPNATANEVRKLIKKLGNNLTRKATQPPHHTLLHLLILNNKNGIYDQIIKELLNKYPQIISTQNGFEQTPLQVLLNQFYDEEYSLQDFRNNVQLLKKADLKETDTLENGYTVIHCLLLTNENGVNDQIIDSLLSLDPELIKITNNKGLTPFQFLVSLRLNARLFKKTALILAKHGADTFSSELSGGNLLFHLIYTNSEGCNDAEIAQLSKNPDILLPSVGMVGKCIAAKNLFEQNLLDPKLKTKKQQTLLHLAVVSDCEEFWEWLLENGVDINAQDEDGKTALHLAIEQNNQLMVEWLILNGACLDLKNNAQQDPLELAEDGANTQLLRILFAPELFKESHFHKIQALAAINLMKEYGERLADPQRAAIITGSREIKRFVKSIDFNDKAPRILANYQNVLAQELNKINREIAPTAEWLGILSSIGNALTHNPLHTAALIADLEVAKNLVAQPQYDIHQKAPLQQTLLHLAVANECEEFWDWLLDNGIDINAQDQDEQTALHLAIKQNNFTMVKWLFRNNANLEILDEAGNTPLILSEEAEQNINDYLSQMPPPAFDQLLRSLRKMYYYGKELQNEGAAEGTIAMSLAKQLREKIKETDFAAMNNELQLVDFKVNFNKLLHSKDDTMSQYRPSWSTIILNISIALTGIGALLIAAKAAHSYINKGRLLFFGQQELTTRETYCQEIDQAIAGLSIATFTR